MISLRRRAPDIRPTIDSHQFREAMSRPNVVREYFLPLDQAWWDGNRFTLGGQGSAARPVQCGVRLQEPRPDSVGPPPERDTQHDLCSLFSSVAELRQLPALSGLVVSEETLVGDQKGALQGKRVVFGLRRSPDDRFVPEARAAGECCRVVRRSIERARYRVEHPKKPFDPATGFAGLQAWAASVRLRRKQDWRPWLLLLLLLPLFFLARSCKSEAPPASPATDTLFGVPVEADSFIILLDKSASMGPYITLVRDEARKLLQERSRDPARLPSADLIVYDAETEAVLGELQPVTPDRIAKITAYLNGMKAGGWTRLSAGMELATRETIHHGRKTTLIVLTDGEDKTIKQLIKDKDKWRARFGKIPVTMHAITPRLFVPGADPHPATPEENDLAELCKCFNGQFGPVGTVP